MTERPEFEAQVRDTLRAAVQQTQAGTDLVERLIGNAREPQHPVVPLRPRRGWVAPLLAAAAVVAVVAGTSAVIATTADHSSPTRPGQSTAPANPTPSASPRPSPSKAASTASTSPPAPTATPHRCDSSVSSIVLTTRSGDGLALQLIYRNTTASTCTMHGYPAVVAVTYPAKSQFAVPQTTTGSLGVSVPIQTISLATGSSASALVEWSPTSSGAGTTCVWVGFLTVTPPSGSVSTRVGNDGLGRVCDVHVLPVVAGTSHDGYVLAPQSQTMLGLVVSHAKTADAYRVVLAPAKRQADGQFVAIPGRATVTFDIPELLVPDNGVTLAGPIEVTTRGPQVTALTVVGG